MGIKVKAPISFVDWCHSLDGFEAMTLTSIRLPQARAKRRFVQGDSTSVYRLGKDSYDFGDPQQDQTLAFYYLVYRKLCRAAGVEPSEYADPHPDTDWPDEVPPVSGGTR